MNRLWCVTCCFPLCGAADTFPLPGNHPLKVPIAMALKFGPSVKPLIDCRLSSPFGNGASTVSGHTDAELFQVRVQGVLSTVEG
jgi:hypothetical protein